ncbi:MAG: acetyl-CoA C-acetyltransferase [Candidatus Azotimanducaceae bacterium]|jgi:acetyl-CoA C-acetyltransferase
MISFFEYSFLNEQLRTDPMTNPKTPVIIGVSQLEQRLSDPLLGKQPIDSMVDAVQAAAEDAGNTALIKDIESLRIIRGVWRYKNPASYVAEKLNLSNIETMGTPYGGNMVQTVVNQSALDILSGARSLIAITGAENGNSQAKAKKAGIELPVTETTGEYSSLIGEDVKIAGEAEMARGIRMPIQLYPMFENAIRHQRKESIEAHRIRVSELWAGFSKVAASNPHAWIKDQVDAETIRTASATNRMVSFPYPKLMNSNNAVDMSAALIMCSVEKAKSLGIPESQWVYPLAGTDAHDQYMLSNRDNLYSSPSIRIAGSRVLELLNLSVADLDHIDVYSCFPSAVQVAISELGLDESKPLTVTGGLTFGGGPLNNYVMHSIARMVELVREAPESKGMITANGGYLTKHAFGVYSGVEPSSDFKYADVQAEVDQTPSRESVIDHNGAVEIESYTVMFGPEGPAMGHAACLLPDGTRTFANTQDKDLMQEMTEVEFCGRQANIDGKGTFTV